MKRLLAILDAIDRRVIYFLVAIALSTPLILKTILPPARMPTATAYYEQIDSLKDDGSIVLISMDWGPNTQGENLPQTLVTLEHLMRRRIPFALITIYTLGSPFLDNVPKEIAAKLEKETGEKWEYGEDWVNWGYRPSPSIMIQGIAKASNLSEHLKADAYGTPLSSIPLMKSVRTIKDISMLIEITGLSGALSYWIKYFQGDTYRPPFLHGCTSISIPESFIYYSSGQLVGLFEGIAGAAWYDKILQGAFPERSENPAQLINTSLAFAHLVIIGLIILGNIAVILGFYINKRDKTDG